MKIGYARVSTKDQSLDVQLEALKKSGCEEIFSEVASATTGQSMSRKKIRPELDRAIQFARKGDTLVATRIDRVARSVKDFLDILTILEEKEVEFEIIEQALDTKRSEGRLLMNMLSVIAQFEADIRRDRQIEGIKKAQKEGKYKGRKKEIDRSKIESMIKEGMSLNAIARELGIAPSSVYRIKEEIKAEPTQAENHE